MAIVKLLLLFTLMSGVLSAPSDSSHKPKDGKSSAKAAPKQSGAKMDHYRVVTIPEGMFVMENSPDFPDTQWSGFYVDLLNAMAKEGNFTFDITKQLDGEYGELTNGKWNGMIGALVDGTADIALGNIVLTKKRAGVIDASSITGNVTAWVLTNPKYGSDTNKVQYLSTDGLILYLLKRSSDPTAKKVYANIKKGLNSSIVATADDGIQKVKSGKFAFVSDEDTVDDAEEENPGQLAVDKKLPVPTTDTVAPFVAKKGSEIAHKLSVLLLGLMTDNDINNPEFAKVLENMVQGNVFQNMPFKK